MTAVLADATFYANRPSYKGEICDSIYENTDINISFTLPEGYEFQSKEVLDEASKVYFDDVLWEYNILGIEGYFDMGAVKDDEAVPSAQVLVCWGGLIDNNTSVYKAIEIMQKKLKENLFNNGAYDVHVDTYSTTFCGEKMACAGAEYTLDGESYFMLAKHENIEEGYFIVFTNGKTQEEAEMLMQGFYRLEVVEEED